MIISKQLHLPHLTQLITEKKFRHLVFYSIIKFANINQRIKFSINAEPKPSAITLYTWRFILRRKADFCHQANKKRFIIFTKKVSLNSILLESVRSFLYMAVFCKTKLSLENMYNMYIKINIYACLLHPNNC